MDGSAGYPARSLSARMSPSDCRTPPSLQNLTHTIVRNDPRRLAPKRNRQLALCDPLVG